MTDIEPYLQRLGLYQYYDAFIAEGFDTWETLVDIQENDLETLNVKLGHRRKLQRAIAESRGVASDRPLASALHDAGSSKGTRSEIQSQQSATHKDIPATGAGEQKRKYRRHPKPDENAPEKPPSAYVLFSNRVREQVKEENLSFTEIARLVGERWQKLDPSQKQLFESHASALKDTYNAQLAEYKKTDAYKEYTQYLADFRAKHSNATDFKRPKLEQQYSSSLSGGEPAENGDQTPGHARSESLGSASMASVTHQPASNPMSALQLVTSMPHLHAPVGRRSSPPPQISQDRQLRGLPSSHSSISEESGSLKFDQADALSRTATLSLETVQGGTPSPSMGSRMGRQEWGYGTGPQTWPTRHPAFGYASSTTPGGSPGSTVASLPQRAVPSDHRRDQGADVTRAFYSGGPRQGQAQPSLLPISQLVGRELSQGPRPPSSQRILPP